MKMMKLIAVGAISTFSVGTAQALECEVQYKAKKTVSEKFLLQEKETQKYKAGTVRGSAGTMSACKKDALRPLKAKGWKVTSSRAKKI